MDKTLKIKRIINENNLYFQDKASMFKTFNQINKYWKLSRFFGVNIGGLKGLVFLFNRTADLYVPKAPKVKKMKS